MRWNLDFSAKLLQRQPALLAIILFISGCTNFPLIREGKSWVQLPGSPPKMADMLASSKDPQSVGVRLTNWLDFKATWFRHDDDDYLVYFQPRAVVTASDGCSQAVYEFTRSDGRWSEQQYAFVVCGE